MTDSDDSGAGVEDAGPVGAEAACAERMHWRRLGLLMDLNEALPLPDGMYFDVADEPEGHLVPPALAADLAEAQAQAHILRAFGLKPWHVGIGPVPWRVRIWRKITFARRRHSWAVAIDELHELLGDPVD